MQQGYADLYVSTYNTSSDNFVNRLPSKKSEAIWIEEDIRTYNQEEGKDIIILQADQNYCVDCYYVIGIVTHEE